ncbi:MAG: peptidase dimerization protein [Acidobacteria bacterium]|nr:MAG: peptidase dimerization protein [Acidobacteriota bacterium]
MNPVALTRQLIDIESVTGKEGPVADFIATYLEELGYLVERMHVEGQRFNIFARPANIDVPTLVFSTHTDTVPPFLPSREDAENIYGRGACDAKGIIAAQIAACEQLRNDGYSVGLLFVVGEERDSLGATVANRNPRGSRFLVAGEPTDNRIALASKGALRVEVTAHGIAAHSAYPELGESAIEKLLDSLQALRAMKLPHNPDIGSSTVNIGIIEGGKATNVIPAFAKAQLLYRLVGPSAELRKDIVAAVGPLADVEFVLDIPYMQFLTVPGIPSMTASFTTDIPKLLAWGEPVLLGPGSILVAHTEREFISKSELMRAIELYVQTGKYLLR